MLNPINLTFENTKLVRIIDQNGDFWFLANDVCNILEIQNTTQVLQSLDDDEKSKLDTISCPMFNIALDNRVKEINIINESRLYTLILRSGKAMQQGTVQHKFRKWVTSEILPTIRKTSTYTPLPNPLTNSPTKIGITLSVWHGYAKTILKSKGQQDRPSGQDCMQ